MKNLIITTVVLLSCLLANSQDKVCDASLKDEVENMAKAMGNEVTYLKDFSIQLPGGSDSNKQPEARFSVVLKENSIYRFAIKSSSQYNSMANLVLFKPSEKASKADVTLASVAHKPSANPAYFDYKIIKTGVYNFKVSFANNEEGCATVILFYIKPVTE